MNAKPAKKKVAVQTTSTFKVNGRGVCAIACDIQDALGNQFILAAPDAKSLKSLLERRFPEMPVSESKFQSVSIVIRHP